MAPESLAKQLERTRFERALEVSESLADHRALLTTAELARLNDIVTGHAPKAGSPPPPPGTEIEPWRQEPVTLTLPSGKTETFALVADPKLTARQMLHRATELAEAGRVIDAAIEIYVGLVLSHVFKDANRRMAVLAAHYFLRRYGISLSGVALHEIGVGDLRDASQVAALREIVGQMAKFADARRDRG